jgi:hypothetical protein
VCDKFKAFRNGFLIRLETSFLMILSSWDQAHIQTD